MSEEHKGLSQNQAKKDTRRVVMKAKSLKQQEQLQGYLKEVLLEVERTKKPFKPPGICMNTNKEENRRMRERITAAIAEDTEEDTEDTEDDDEEDEQQRRDVKNGLYGDIL